MFGASLKGLIPTAMCIVSGIWLWMKEVIRSGREVEWSSEQSRGETVSDLSQQIRQQESGLTTAGNCKSASRIRRMDEHLTGNCLGLDKSRHVCFSRRYS
jgi:hypothetical protein